MPLIAIVGMGPGVAAAVARRFGREGYAVAGIARRADALKELTDALAGAGIAARGWVADAGDPAAVGAALGKAADAQGPIDVLVYNAVAVHFKPLAELLPEELDAALRVSGPGALAAARAVLPAMRSKGSGTLLFTGGGFAFEPNPKLATVGAGKAVLRNLAFSLFADLKESGIHAATVTIAGMIKAGTPFDPDRIAEAFWTLHAQPPGSFERELVFKG